MADVFTKSQRSMVMARAFAAATMKYENASGKHLAGRKGEGGGGTPLMSEARLRFPEGEGRCSLRVLLARFALGATKNPVVGCLLAARFSATCSVDWEVSRQLRKRGWKMCGFGVSTQDARSCFLNRLRAASSK